MSSDKIRGWALRDAGWEMVSTGEKLVYLVNNNAGRASALLRSDGEYALRAVNAHAALVKALKGADAWFFDPDADPVEQFERIGDEYRRATGYLRPGKSEPAEMGLDSNSDENRQRFAEWCKDRSRKALASIRAAIALAEGK